MEALNGRVKERGLLCREKERLYRVVGCELTNGDLGYTNVVAVLRTSKGRVFVMKRLMVLGLCGLAVMVGLSKPVAADEVIEASLTMTSQLTTSDGLVLTYISGHGWNAAYAYTYTDVNGSVQWDEDGENTGAASQSASASTANGSTDSSVTVNTAGFNYSLMADASAQGLGVGDYAFGMGYANAWPDYLRTDHAGTATLTLSYDYTLDTRNTGDDGEAYVYMDAFLADHAGTNYLTAQGDWTVGYGDNLNTRIVEFTKSIGPNQYLTGSGSVSWDVTIPSTAEPNNWWSTWSEGKAGFEGTIVPEPSLSVLALAAVVTGAAARRKKKKTG